MNIAQLHDTCTVKFKTNIIYGAPAYLIFKIH